MTSRVRTLLLVLLIRPTALVCLALVVTCCNPALADLVHPPGLNAGDQYRLVFVTSTDMDATSSDIADYNSFVNAAAAARNAIDPDFPASGWTAIASTVFVDASANTDTSPLPGDPHGLPIYRVDGALVARDNMDLWDGRIESPIRIDESGAVRDTFVWTGTAAEGNGLSPLGGGVQVMTGVSDASDSWWTYSYTEDMREANSLYAISSPITVPEPSAFMCLALMGLGWVGVVAVRKRRARSSR